MTFDAAVQPARDFARAASIVWQRELLRYARDRGRIATGLVQPLLYLFVLGRGLSPLMAEGTGGLVAFLFPGVVLMSVVFTSLTSAGSLVWDREFGFLRAMTVAPVSARAVLLGKCAGGATAGTLQGLLVLGVGAAAGLVPSWHLLPAAVAILVLAGFAMTALGMCLSTRAHSMAGFAAAVQGFAMPMFFLSGAMVPLAGLPPPLDTIARCNPLTYAVLPLRELLRGDGSGLPETAWAPLTWSGRALSPWACVACLLLVAFVAFALAARGTRPGLSRPPPRRTER